MNPDKVIQMTDSFEESASRLKILGDLWSKQGQLQSFAWQFHGGEITFASSDLVNSPGIALVFREMQSQHLLPAMLIRKSASLDNYPHLEAFSSELWQRHLLPALWVAVYRWPCPSPL